MSRVMTSVFSGLGGMLGWGTSDFLANSASEKFGYLKTFFWSQLAGLSLIATLLLIFQSPLQITLPLLALTIVGGTAYAFGYLFLYKGFEIGNVSVISAVINVQVVFITIISYMRGQSLTPIQIPAVLFIMIGVTLTAVNINALKNGTLSLLHGVKETLISTAFFGIIEWPLNEYIVENADWLLVSFLTKLAALAVVLLFANIQRQTLQLKKIAADNIALLIAVGLLEAVGILSVSYGQAFGDGIIVAPISSALTVVTVTLAIIFQKEKISKVQGAGIMAVIIGIFLTAL